MRLQSSAGNQAVVRLSRQAPGEPQDPVLSSWSQGEPVRRAQRLLNDAGGDLEADGIFGPATRGAVVAFQRAADLADDGIVGAATWAALRSGRIRFHMPRPTLQLGASGSHVARAQLLLNAAGADLATDSIFGPLTRGAVQAFQQSADLTADGTVGPATWIALQAQTSRTTGGTTGGGPDTLEGLRDRLASAREALQAAIDTVTGQLEPRPAQARSADSEVATEILGLAVNAASALDANADALNTEFGDEVAALESIVSSVQAQLPAPGPEVTALSDGLDAVAHGLASKATLGKPVTTTTATGSTTITVARGTAITFDAENYAALYTKLDQRAQQGLESGRTESQIEDYGFVAEPAPGGGVRVKQASLKIKETVQGCDWPQEGTACEADRKKWETYQKAIDTHEFGHVGVDKQAFAKGHERMAGLTGTDQDDLQTKVDAAVTELENEASEANDKWHKTTAGKVPALPPGSC